MKILITGGTGFVGFHLASLHREHGDEVWLLDNLAKTGGQSDPDLDSLLADRAVHLLRHDLTLPIRGLDCPAGFDVVYHLAAINGTRLFYEMPYELARANLLITINLLDWLADRQVGRLLYSSTSEVYADCEPLGLLAIPTDEAVPVAFVQPTASRFSYGVTKFAGELLCTQFGRTRRVPTTVVRYHNVYGPRMGDKHVIPEFIARMAARETPFGIFGGDETRAFCHVRDSVEATRLCAISPACVGQIVHIGNAMEEIRIRDLAELLMDDHFGGRWEIIERGRREASVSRRCPATQKLERLTGFKARVMLAEGLADTVRWYRVHSQSHAG
jgi:UDP-glucose 4-epimerase/UDP-glucuronate decarboxylase